MADIPTKVVTCPNCGVIEAKDGHQPPPICPVCGHPLVVTQSRDVSSPRANRYPALPSQGVTEKT